MLGLAAAAAAAVRHQLATTAPGRMLSPIARILDGGTSSDGSESPAPRAATQQQRAAPPLLDP